MQKHNSKARSSEAEAQRITRQKNKAARAALLASDAVPDELRPGWEIAVAASSIKGGPTAFFGGSLKSLKVSLTKADMPLSVIWELERMGLLMLYSQIGRGGAGYIFVSLQFPITLPDEYTAEQKRIALSLIDKHQDELQPYEHTAAVYAVACSFAIHGGQLRLNINDLLLFLDVYHTSDFSKFQELIELWKADGIIKELLDTPYFVMFDYNYLTGDWGEN